MIVGPSMPTPMTSRMPGTPARPISWLTMTWSSGPRPWPPYSAGHVTPARPPSASLRCHVRGGAASSRSPSPRRGASRLVLLEPGAHLGAVLGLLGGVVQVQGEPPSCERGCSDEARYRLRGRTPRSRRRSRDRRRAERVREPDDRGLHAGLGELAVAADVLLDARRALAPRAARRRRPRAPGARCVTAISAGSRPSAAHARAARRACARTVAASPNRLQASACRATSRSVRRSPEPPTRIGIRSCSGRG